MVAQVAALTTDRPIIEQSGESNEEMREWTQLITDRVNFLIPIKGRGAPEGVVEALEDRMYRDTLGVASSIMYVKTADDVAGDKTLGWILV